ncbi:hypothetical protein [Gynuella sunshinyii]|uniref:Putative exporter n=1 Tax=Gynuella sunshinyii YC6258 TaxID=1445510 RepID=A0A0C5VEI2_9GAMM|nr:hypothetical protein [Gynuella sunshinyii]AJQ92967.1 putative exporter [Gynuella sunshinyii YC6258]
MQRLNNWWLQPLISVILLTLLWVAKPVTLQTDLLSLLPQESSSPLQQAMQENISQNQARTINLLLLADNLETVSQAAGVLQQSLRKLDLAEQTEGSFEPWVNMITSHPGAFLTPEYLQALTAQDPEQIRLLFETELNRNFAPWLARSIDQDSTLASAAFLNLAANSFDFQSRAWRLRHDRHDYAALFTLQLKTDLTNDLAQPLIDGLESTLQQLKNQFPDISVYKSGSVFHALFTTAQAKKEISFSMGLSLLAIIILIVGVYRSAWPAVISLLVLTNAVLAGLLGLWIFFQQVHLLSLVFAVSLLGIAGDYGFHAMSTARHHRLWLNKIRVPLILGLLTTIIGYLTLQFTPIALLHQVGIFMIAGLLGAFLTVTVSARQLIQNIHKRTPAREHCPLLQPLNNAVYSFRLLVSAGLILVLTATAMWIGRPLFDDDTQLLYAKSTTLANEAKIIQHWRENYSHQYVFIDSPEAERASEALDHFVNTLEHDGIQTLSLQPLLRNTQQQQEATALMLAAKTGGFLNFIRDDYGMKLPTFEEDAASIEDQLAALPELSSSLYVTGSAGTGFSVRFKTESNLQEIKQISNQLGLVYVDIPAQISAKLGQYRQHLLTLTVISVLLVAVVLWVRYGYRRVAWTLSPILLAMAVSAILTVLIQGELNTFHLISQLLILALGIDCVIFYADKGLTQEVQQSVLLSAGSSTAVFAILAFSHTPAVASFGLSIAIGLAAILILSPMAASKTE